MTGAHRKTAEVAIALPVDGLFHYLVPKKYAEAIQPGARVLAPFGKRRVTGYVFGVSGPDEPPPAGIELKEITRPLDEEPLIGTELIPFLRFVSGYYHYPLGLVAAEALPSGLKVMSLKTAHLTDVGREILNRGELPADELALMQRLDRARGAALTRLVKENPAHASLIRRFESRGWVVAEQRLNPERVGPRTQRWLSAAPDPVDPQKRLGPREQELLDRLRENGALSIDDLREDFPSLSGMISRLLEKDLIRVEERPVFRDALGRTMTCRDQPPVLTGEQQRAVDVLTRALRSRTFSPYVLHGVTGPGKTEVYMAAMRQALDLGRSVLMLVPEISLTPVVEGLLRARFKEDVGVLHSGLSDGERYDQWFKIKSGRVRIVLGARSAIFAPLDRPGPIVVDEEHDGAYKQEEKLRYQARDLAVLRAQQAGAVVCLGSATPSLESFHAARTGRYGLLTLAERVNQGRLPRVDVVDLRYETGRRVRGALTPILKSALEETLGQGRQALLFINRRGLASFPMCLSCGHVFKCLNCSVTMTLHQCGSSDDLRMNCHHCGLEMEPPQSCPECRSKLIRFMGLGTERIVQEVAKAFPEARVARLDADSARPKGELTRILKALRDGTVDVLIGTQMVTKGHDFPNITLVGVIEADLGLHLPDFRAGERTFQILAQVGGRAGRGKDEGRVIVQTYSPEHYTLLLAKRHDYIGFFEEEIKQRGELHYPPFSRIALARFQGNSEERTAGLAEAAVRLGGDILRDDESCGVNLLGPAPAPLAKVKGKYRFHVLIRSDQVTPLHRFLNQWTFRLKSLLKQQGVSYTLDIDPYQMM